MAEQQQMKGDTQLEEDLILAWIHATGVLKNTRITQKMIYNEAVVMSIVYERYREDGVGAVTFGEICRRTRMLKSLVNRTIDALVEKGMLVRCEGVDKRTTLVRIQPEHIAPYLAVHERSLELAHSLREIIGDEDAEAFVRISRKISERIREEAAQGRTGKP